MLFNEVRMKHLIPFRLSGRWNLPKGRLYVKGQLICRSQNVTICWMTHFWLSERNFHSNKTQNHCSIQQYIANIWFYYGGNCIILMFVVCIKKAWDLSYPLSAQRRLRSAWASRLWSYWAVAEADLCLRWAHMPFFWFCRVAAQFYSIYGILWTTASITLVRRLSLGSGWNNHESLNLRDIERS